MVVTDSKSEGSHNTECYNGLDCPVVTDSKSEGSHNHSPLFDGLSLLLLIANLRVVTTKVSISQNMSNYNDN